MQINYTHSIKRSQIRLTSFLFSVILLFAIVGIVFAWDRNFTSSPYTGSFFVYKTQDGNYQQAHAYNIKWDTTGTQTIDNDIMPTLDMTADCTQDDPGQDQLNFSVSYSNIPNAGWAAWSDCGDSNIKEEAELVITGSLVQAETSYYYDVHYSINKRYFSGHINLTFERSNSPTHDWLDKAAYTN